MTDTDKLKRLADGLRPFVGRRGSIRIDTDEAEAILALITENERLREYGGSMQTSYVLAASERDELLKALEAIKRVANNSKDEFHGMTQGERAISSCGVISAHVDRLLAKHKGPQS